MSIVTLHISAEFDNFTVYDAEVDVIVDLDDGWYIDGVYMMHDGKRYPVSGDLGALIGYGVTDEMVYEEMRCEA